MSKPTGLQFTVRVGPLPADTFVVTDFQHREWLSNLFELTLGLASADSGLKAMDALDQPAELSIWQDGQLQRRVRGIVRAFERGDTGHRRTRYTLQVVPPLWRLSLMHNSRIFQRQDPQAIVATLLEERGILDTTFNLKRSAQAREYCVQHRESDYDFLSRLAAEEGWHLRTDGDSDTGALVIADHHRDAPTLADAPYNASAGGASRQPCVYRFGVQNQVAVARATLKDYTFSNPAYALMHQHQAEVGGSQRTDYEHYDYPGRFKADASGQPFTQARLDALRNTSKVAHGASNRADFTAGARFPLTDHSHEPHNRNWLITAVTHTGTQPQALEEEGGSGPTTYNNTFEAVAGNQTWRPDPPRRPVMDGPQMAIVTGPEGEEIHCDEHGRVKVRFPWDRRLQPGKVKSSENDEHSSAWLRVSQGWAGGSYGFMALPRIGHEVIVSFLDGDPDQPIITGRTYHATNTPPYALPAHKTRTILKTQSHKGEGSNELRFEDEADKEQIYVHAQKDLDLLTEHDRTEVVHNNSHLTVDSDRISHIKANDHSTVDGEKREKVGGDSSLTVGGTHHSKQGKSQLVEAGNEIHHKAGIKLVIEAGAEITLKAGGSFVKVDPSGVTVSGPMVKMNSGGGPGSGTGVAVKAPGLPEALQAAGQKVAPVALAGVGQRPNAAAGSARAFSGVAVGAKVAKSAAPASTVLKGAVSAGSPTLSDCEYDENGRCKIHQHGAVANTNVVLPESQSSSSLTKKSGDTKHETTTENAVESGFHVVRQPMSKNELVQSLYDVSAKPDHFDRLNPDIGTRVLPGEMIVLGDPGGTACTQEEADLMRVASQVNQKVRALDAKEAQFLTDHYDLLEAITSDSATGMGAGATMISRQIKGIESTLRELEALHQTAYSKHGHLNSPDFFAKRKQLFKQLDFSLGNIARKGMSLDDNPKLKSALGLSSKSIVHSWKQAGVGDIPGYATHYDKLATGAKYARAGGYLSIALDASVSGMKIHAVCSNGRAQECTKVKYTEGGRLVGSVGGGAGGAWAGAALCGIATVTSAGIGGIACAIILGGAGSAVGGYAGGAALEEAGETLYRHVENE